MFEVYDGYVIFTLIWCTLCMLIGFMVVGFTIYEFDHPSLLLIRSDSYRQTLVIRVSTMVSLVFYCIALICYTAAAYDDVIKPDLISIYHEARTGMFICYVIAYLSMVIVLMERLKQMTLYINKQYSKTVYATLIILIVSCIAVFSVFYFIHHRPNHSIPIDAENEELSLFFGLFGFVIHVVFSLLIIFLFCNRLYQHIWLQQRHLIVSSSTDNYRDQHDYLVMLNLCKRYTSLSILCILSTFVLMVPVVMYVSNSNQYNDYDHHPHHRECYEYL
eukprot:180399_1